MNFSTSKKLELCFINSSDNLKKRVLWVRRLLAEFNVSGIANFYGSLDKVKGYANVYALWLKYDINREYTDKFFQALKELAKEDNIVINTL